LKTKYELQAEIARLGAEKHTYNALINNPERIAIWSKTQFWIGEYDAARIAFADAAGAGKNHEIFKMRNRELTNAIENVNKYKALHNQSIPAVRDAQAKIENIDFELQECRKLLLRLEEDEAEGQESERQSKREYEKIEAEKQRDHELQMALIQRDTAIAQIEATRLAVEAAEKAQEQANGSLDALIKGMKGDG